MKNDREKEIKYEMYLHSQKIKEEKKELKKLKEELEILRNRKRRRVRKNESK